MAGQLLFVPVVANNVVRMIWAPLFVIVDVLQIKIIVEEIGCLCCLVTDATAIERLKGRLFKAQFKCFF